MTYKDPSILETFALKDLRENINIPAAEPRTQRYIIPLITDLKKISEGSNLIQTSTQASAIKQGNRIVLTPAALCDHDGLEFPTINRSFLGRKTKFVYAMGPLSPSVFRKKICKLNLDTKEVVTFGISKKFFPGEPFFVPEPGAEGEEDKGIVVAAMSNTVETGQDCLVFLDSNMKEIGRATFVINPIPSAFHGLFIRSD